MAHSYSIRIKVATVAMHILTVRILDVSNPFQNTNFTIHERVCVSPPPYYIDWFEIFYPNFPINQDDGTFLIQ